MRKENPMPDNQTDQDLAGMFAAYFLGKIETIREDLNKSAQYKTSNNDNVSKLNQFQSVDQQEIGKITRKLSTK